MLLAYDNNKQQTYRYIFWKVQEETYIHYKKSHRGDDNDDQLNEKWTREKKNETESM